MALLLALMACLPPPASDDPVDPDSTVETSEDTSTTPSTEPACRFPSGFAFEARAQATDGGPLHPWPTVSDATVTRTGDRYRMWYSAADWSGAGTPPWEATDLVLGTTYAESDDGITWDIAPPARDHQVTLVLEPDGWDALGVETPTVAPSADGDLLLWYTGDEPPDFTYGIGLARSHDGVDWEREGDGPTLAPDLAWELPVCGYGPCFGGVLEPTVLVEADGTLRIWYAAWGMLDGAFATRMGTATSADGVAWDKHPEPVFAPGEPGAWDDAIVSHFAVAADPVRGYHLFYYGVSQVDSDACGDCNFTPGWIGHAFSEDGIHWERNPANPILRADTPEFTRWFLGGPSPLFEDGAVRLWYFTSDTAQDALESRLVIELATGSCP